MFCPKCGKQIPDTSRFCGGCGSAVTPLSGGVQKGAAQAPKPPKPEKAPQAPKPEKAPKPPKPEKAPKPPKPEKPPKPPKPPKEPKQPREGNGSKAVLILVIVLAVLLVVAAGMGVYYFVAVKDGGLLSERFEERDAEEEVEEETETGEEPEESEDDGQENADDASGEAAGQEEAPEEDGVVSDTNEVVGDRILEDIPKAVYAYRFDGELDGAETAVREEPETEPETTDGEEAQYVRGMDGDAIKLDGSYGLKLSNVESLGDSYTVAFWIKAEEFCNWSPFIHVGRNLLDEKNRCRLWIGQKPDGEDGSVGPILSSERATANDSVEIRADGAAQESLMEGVWYHIAFTVDGATQGSKSGRVLGKLYLAGTEVGRGDVVVDAMNGDDFDVYLGINCWDQLYPVAFDDVKIWDQALSAEQIASLFEAYN